MHGLMWLRLQKQVKVEALMDEKIVKDAIEVFYQGGGVPKRFTGKVNERVAEVFGIMLEETRKCSDSLAWVPKPTSGKAMISWIARNLSRSTIERFRDSVSLTCAKKVILQWEHEMYMAGMGFR